MNVEILARIQFAFTIAFHYIYPPLSIGLGLVMVFLEGLYLKTKNKQYEILARFWTRIFALTFGIGVATGIVMEFEFGTNWATYSRYVGDIFGSALAAEGIFAFALESGCLGILLFGWDRVKPPVHFLSTLGVWLGSMFSAVWIVVANSWQQTPAGYMIEGEGIRARAVVTDFWDMVWNPSSLDRILHVWLGAILAGVFLVLSVHAYYLIKGRFVDVSKKAFSIALVLACVFSLLQVFSGHSSAKVVAKYQPAKLAAIEGLYRSDESPTGLYILGWVDKKNEMTYGVKIPGLLSFLVYGDFKTPVTGLDAFALEDRPSQINTVFQLYRIMIGIGIFLIILSLYAMWRWRSGKLFSDKKLLSLFVFSVILPQVANQVGWFTAEMGRQPWVVYKLLRTSDALSKAVKAEQVLFSLILFGLVYSLLFVLFIFLLNRKIQHGPDENTDNPDDVEEWPRHKEMVYDIT